MRSHHSSLLCCLVTCVALSAALSSAPHNAQLKCIVYQAQATTRPTVDVLPDGSLVFNQLQDAIDRCPFTEIYIPPDVVVPPAIGCVTIANRRSPLILSGSPEASYSTSGVASPFNRSTLAVNASVCAAAFRTSLISITGSAGVEVRWLDVAVVDVALPWHSDETSNSLSVVLIENSQEIVLSEITMNVVVQSTMDLRGWSSLVQIVGSTNVALSGGSLCARTLLYASSKNPDHATVDHDPVPGVQPPPINGSLPMVHLVLIEWSTGVSLQKTALTLSSDVGRACRVFNATDVSIAGVLAEIDLLLPPPFVTPDNRTIFPPNLAQRHALLFERSNGVSLVESSVVIVCGLYCSEALFPAVIYFGDGGSSNGSAPPLSGVLLRDLSLTVVGTWQTPNVMTSITFIVVNVQNASCMIIDNITASGMPSLMSNAVIFQVANAMSSVISRVVLTTRRSQTSTDALFALPMIQAIRFFPTPSDDLLLWSDVNAPPIPPALLKQANQSCALSFLAPQQDANEPSSAFCCRSTLFWVVLAISVVLLLTVSVFVVNHRRHSDHELLVKGDLQEDDHINSRRDVASDTITSEGHQPARSVEAPPAEEPSASILTEPLIPSTALMLHSVRSPQDTDDRFEQSPQQSYRMHMAGLQQQPALSRANSGTQSDAVLYMPHEGWSTRSMMGGKWVWGPGNPSRDMSRHNSASAASMASSRLCGHQSPLIAVSPPKQSTIPSVPVVVVQGTADAVPFQEVRCDSTRFQDVHSSDYSSSDDGGDKSNLSEDDSHDVADD